MAPISPTFPWALPPPQLIILAETPRVAGAASNGVSCKSATVPKLQFSPGWHSPQLLSGSRYCTNTLSLFVNVQFALPLTSGHSLTHLCILYPSVRDRFSYPRRDLQCLQVPDACPGVILTLFFSCLACHFKKFSFQVCLHIHSLLVSLKRKIFFYVKIKRLCCCCCM